MAAPVHSFLAYISGMSIESAVFQKAGLEFLDSLRSELMSVLDVFSNAGGPATLIQVLRSPDPSVRDCANDIVKKVLTCLVLGCPRRGIETLMPLKVLKQIFQATDECTDLAFQNCRSELVLHLIELIESRSISFRSLMSGVMMRELTDSFLRQLEDIRVTHKNIHIQRLIQETKNLTRFIRHLRRICLITPGDNSIECLMEKAKTLFNYIAINQGALDCENGLCWSTFLLLLAILNEASKSSCSVRHKLSSLLTQRKIELNVLVQKYIGEGCCFSCGLFEPLILVKLFICDRSFLTPRSRESLAMNVLQEPNNAINRHFIFTRDRVLEESFERLMNIELQVLKGGISIEFANEVATGPGVLREWFSLISRKLFNPKLKLFSSCPTERNRFFPYQGSDCNPRHLDYFRFCGRIIALALMHGRVKIDVKLARFFFKKLARRQITWEDVKDADPELYVGCKKILEMDPEEVDNLCLTFDADICVNGSLQNVELCKGGHNIAVHNNNRDKYLNLYVRKRLVEVVEKQMGAFEKGFNDLLDLNLTISDFLHYLYHKDLDMIISGLDSDISVLDWKMHTLYAGYTSSDKEIEWFWQIVEAMDNKQRRKLLFFSMAIECLPSQGFSGLPKMFYICKEEELGRLPTAHTCFYQLNLPPYPSFETMRNKLYAIIADGMTTGFGIE